MRYLKYFENINDGKLYKHTNNIYEDESINNRVEFTDTEIKLLIKKLSQILKINDCDYFVPKEHQSYNHNWEEILFPNWMHGGYIYKLRTNEKDGYEMYAVSNKTRKYSLEFIFQPNDVTNPNRPRISIYNIGDEWYIVSCVGGGDYKCDTIDGIVECLKDNLL